MYSAFCIKIVLVMDKIYNKNKMKYCVHLLVYGKAVDNRLWEKERKWSKSGPRFNTFITVINGFSNK